MIERHSAPYGSWRSPITAELLVAGGMRLGEVHPEGTDCYWVETRPLEGGRNVLVRRTESGEISDVTPSPFNVRTRVHEYGGGAYGVAQGVAYFSHFADGHIYKVGPGPVPILVASEAGMRYADFVLDLAHSRLLCIREDHTGGGQYPQNAVVAVSLNGGPDEIIASGNDFYAAPRLSPDGRQLCWLTWNHPNMPWDGTELWLADLAVTGEVSGVRLVAGGPSESIFQPEWSPAGALHFVSDRTGWWNLYRLDADGAVPLAPLEAEFGGPQWALGAAQYAFAGPDRIICAYSRHGRMYLADLTPSSGVLTDIDLPFTAYSSVRIAHEQVTFVGASPTEPSVVASLDLSTGQVSVLRPSSSSSIDPGYLCEAAPLEFPTDGGLSAHALYYAPTNRDFAAPEGERPPLIVLSHGGPTGATGATLSLEIQYWTSRGFAIVDVNYGGSTGYGRAYRERLNGQWGVVDVADCTNAALYLAGQGLADPQRLAIRGGSAGGYTTLAALVFTEVFRAGVSFFGVSDIGALASDTHKFESRYMDRLVGPYPEAKALHDARSPINFVDQLNCPVIFYQGLDDKVVPPNQAELMVAALEAKGLPVAYIAYEGEGHGFRKAENIRHSLESQLYFFGQVFGFTPADDLTPVYIQNL